MLYQAPYGSPGGPNDTTAHYINGNPSTGTMGSIPPAAAIENPQREIVNLITDAGGTPTDADLHQLAKAVQSGKLFYGVDFGTANTYSANVSPPLLAYAAGQRWAIKVLNTNTGPSTLNLSGLGGRPVIYPGGAALRGNELVAGQIATLIDDGTNLQLQNVGPSPLGGRLFAPMTYYVNAATGSDTAYDGTASTVSGTHGPFATVNKAISAATSWNQNGFSVTINIATGSYPPIITQPINGSGYIDIVGNRTTPSSVLIHATTGPAILVQQCNGYTLHGLKVQSDANGTGPNFGIGIWAISSSLNLENIDYGLCYANHLSASTASSVTYYGTGDLNPTAFYNVSGDTTGGHMVSGDSSRIYLDGAILNTIGPRSIPIWANATQGGVIAGNYSAQNIGGAVTGSKFSCTLNGVINTGGGINYFPGSLAGTSNTGGQVA